MTDAGYIPADSGNLPVIDVMMMASFFGNNPNFVSAEIRGTKTARTVAGCYGDEGVGWVQVKKSGDLCTVKARMTPEHRVRSKAYNVELICDEKDGNIISVTCEDCTASAGGCKHAVAFLGWLHRRSHDPSPTSVTCYWRKSKLSSIGTSIKFIKACDLGSKKVADITTSDGSFLSAILDHSKIHDISNNISKFYQEPSDVLKLSIHRLCLLYTEMNTVKTSGGFLMFCSINMAPNICKEAEIATRRQRTCPLWFELRYGRITASKAHEAANCHTMDGVLVDSILGARKLKDNPALRRGRDLEPKVLAVLESTLNMKFHQSGLLLDPLYPVIGASPDGVSDDFIVEIKCPGTEKSMKTYYNTDGTVAAKHLVQVQLQMFLAKKKRAIFCVADYNFESNNDIKIIYVDLDERYCIDIIHKCTAFWEAAIYSFISK